MVRLLHASGASLYLLVAVAVSCGEGGQRLVIFGGYNAEGFLSDVWEFDLGTREWARVDIAAGPAPPRRAYFRGDLLA